MSSINFLSVFVALAMFLSGGYHAEDPDAYSARTLRISDVLLTIGREEYPIDLVPSVGVATENGSALFDFSVRHDDDSLYPLQILAKPEGDYGIALGENDEVYTFSPDALTINFVNLPENTDAILGSFQRLLTTIGNLYEGREHDQTFAEIAEQWLGGNVQNISTEETSLELEGETVPATRRTYTLNPEQSLSMVEAVANHFAPGCLDAYNALISYATVISPSGEPLQSGGLLARMGVELHIDVEEILTADGYGRILINFNFTSVHPENPFTFNIPVETNCLGGDLSAITIDAKLPVPVGQESRLYASASLFQENYVVSIELTGGEHFGFSLSNSRITNEQGQIETVLNTSLSNGAFAYDFVVLSTLEDNGCGSALINLGLNGNANLSLRAEIDDEPIPDRISNAETVHYDTPEEEEAAFLDLLAGWSSLNLASRTVAQDEDIAGAVHALQSLLGAPAPDDSAATDADGASAGFADHTDADIYAPPTEDFAALVDADIYTSEQTAAPSGSEDFTALVDADIYTVTTDEDLSDRPDFSSLVEDDVYGNSDGAQELLSELAPPALTFAQLPEGYAIKEDAVAAENGNADELRPVYVLTYTGEDDGMPPELTVSVVGRLSFLDHLTPSESVQFSPEESIVSVEATDGFVVVTAIRDQAVLEIRYEGKEMLEDLIHSLIENISSDADGQSAPEGEMEIIEDLPPETSSQN